MTVPEKLEGSWGIEPVPSTFASSAVTTVAVAGALVIDLVAYQTFLLPGWWTNLVSTLDPPKWGICATVPSFLVSFAAAGVVAVLSRRAEAGAATA